MSHIVNSMHFFGQLEAIENSGQQFLNGNDDNKGQISDNIVGLRETRPMDHSYMFWLGNIAELTGLGDLG